VSLNRFEHSGVFLNTSIVTDPQSGLNYHNQPTPSQSQLTLSTLSQLCAFGSPDRRKESANLRQGDVSTDIIAGRVSGIGNIRDQILAAVVSALAAIVAFVAMVVISIFLGTLLFKMNLLTDEVAAWFGIGFGFPVGLVVALVAFFFCFRRLRTMAARAESRPPSCCNQAMALKTHQ
jgi:hypothetical protein